MGTINYRTSDYITLGVKPIDYYDVEHDPELMEELQNLADENDWDIDQAIADYVYVCYDDDFSNVEFELSRCDFAFLV